MSISHDEIYLNQLVNILNFGTYVKDDQRTGEDVYEIFGIQNKFKVSEQNFPLLTTKKVFFKTVVAELLWMLSGSTSLADLDSKIWDLWRVEDKGDDLGPIYGKQWRDFGGVDQISKLVENLRKTPRSRRHIVTAWNPPDVEVLTSEFAAPPPCHCFFQVHDDIQNGLSLQLYQRSCDWMVGMPYNLAFYSLLLIMLGKVLNRPVNYFIHTVGSAHVYAKHIEQAKKQIANTVLDPVEISVTPKNNIFEYTKEDFQVVKYISHAYLPLFVAK